MKPLRRLWPLAVIALAIVAFFALGLHRLVSVETLAAERARVDAFVSTHQLGAVALYLFIFVVGVAICLPVSAVLTMIGGYLFGVWLAPPLILTAMTTGAVITFLATRGPLSAFARARAGSHLDRFERGFRADGFNYLLALRLVPVMPFPVMTLASALLDVRLRDFILATVIAITPVTIVLASVGAALRAALAAGASVDPAAAASRLLFSPQALLPIAGLILLALAPVIAKRLRSRSAPES